MKLHRTREPANPTKGSLVRIDDAAKVVQPSDKSLRDWCGRYLVNHRRRLAFDLDLLERVAPPGARVLEIGSTPLAMTAAVAAAGYELIGADIAPERFLETIQATGLNVRKCDIENEPLPGRDGEYDVILFNEVFEHLRVDLIATFEEVHRVLKRGGVLLLSTPNLRSADGLANFLLKDHGHACQQGIYEQYSKLRTLGHMGHVREYTVSEVVEFLTEIGFASEEINYRGSGMSRWSRLIGRIVPSLRPFFTCIARKA